MILFGIVQIVWTLLGIKGGESSKKSEAGIKEIHDQTVDMMYVWKTKVNSAEAIGNSSILYHWKQTRRTAMLHRRTIIPPKYPRYFILQ